MGFRMPFVRIITAARFQTRLTGNRIVIDGISGPIDRINMYSGVDGEDPAQIAVLSNGTIQILSGRTDPATEGTAWLQMRPTDAGSPRMQFQINEMGTQQGISFRASDSSGNHVVYGFTADEGPGTSETLLEMRHNIDDPIYIRVEDSLKQITQGADDSGGSGFAVLRVPN